MSTPVDVQVAAIVLAAGRSQRMGQPKMILPWGDTTVVGQVVRTLAQAHLSEIVVVTGGDRQVVEQALQEQPTRTVYNPRFAEDQMALSLQAGLASLLPGVEAALIVLGDQPQIQLEVVQMVIRRFQQSRAQLVFPSYRMRRGHPWLIARPLWEKLGAASVTGVEKPGILPVQSLRDFLQTFADQITYIEVANDSILRDVDTPSDYLKERPVQPGATGQEKP